jgi:hypothetical protein
LDVLCFERLDAKIEIYSPGAVNDVGNAAEKFVQTFNRKTQIRATEITRRVERLGFSSIWLTIDGQSWGRERGMAE